MGSRNTARLLLFITAFLWGTSFPVIRLGLQYLPTFTFLSLRFLIATIVTAIWIASTRRLKEFIETLKTRFVVFTGILNGLGYTFQFIGQNYTYATNASLLINTSPIFTAISAHFILGEKLNKFRVGAILLAFTGSAIIIMDSYGRALTLGALGDFLCLLGGFSWGLYVTYSKKLADKEAGSWILLASWFAITTVMALPFAVYEFIGKQITLNSLSIGVVLYMSLACTVTAFALWFAALRIMEASTSSAYFILEIVVSAILESIMFNTIITTLTVLGATMVVIGVYLTDYFYRET